MLRDMKKSTPGVIVVCVVKIIWMRREHNFEHIYRTANEDHQSSKKKKKKKKKKSTCLESCSINFTILESWSINSHKFT